MASALNFVSYKREQRPFAESLIPLLSARGHGVWLDTRGLLPSEPWGPGVRNAILACQAFIVVLEEGWLQSRPFQDELACAVEHGKRIVVVVAPLHDERSFKADIEQNPALAPLLPAEVASRNFIWSRRVAVETVADQISTALQLDFAWNARSSWIQQCAVAWNNSGRRHGLLRGEELTQTLHEVDRARDSLPKPTGLALEFLRASQVEHQNDVLLTEAEYEWREGHFDDALERNRESWRLTKNAGSQPGARHILMAHRLLELQGGSHHLEASVDTAALAENGAWLALASGNDISLWKSETVRGGFTLSSGSCWPEAPDRCLTSPGRADRVACLAFDAPAALLAAGAGSVASVWDIATGRETHRLRAATGRLSQLEFSRDGHWLLAAGARSSVVWDLRSGSPRPAGTFPAGTSLAMRGAWLVQVTRTPRCTVSLAPLDHGRKLDFRIRHRLPQAAEHVALREDGAEWGAVCGAQVYRCEPHRQGAVTEVLCDLHGPIEVDDAYAPFDHLVLRPRPPLTVKAFGYVAGCLTAVVERIGMGAFVVWMGAGGSVCKFADVVGRIAALAVTGDDWTIILSDGTIWFGTPTRGSLEPAGAPVSHEAALICAGSTRLCGTPEGTNFFWRGVLGNTKPVRRRSPIPSPQRQISRDGELVLEFGRRGLTLWDVPALGTKAIPRVLADTGIITTALGAHPDGKSLAAGTGDRLFCWSEHGSREIRDVHLVQGLGASARADRWIAVDANGRLVSWRVGPDAGPGADRVLQLGRFPTPPISVVVDPRGEWGVFSQSLDLLSSEERHCEFVDLRDPGGTRVPLDSGRPLPRGPLALAVSPDGRLVFVDGALWEVVEGRPTMRGLLPVQARCLAAGFCASGELMTVHDDAAVRRWTTADPHGPSVLETFDARVGAEARILHACLSASAGWLAFTEESDASEPKAFVMPAEGARVASVVNIPHSHRAVLLGVDDSGSWVIGAGDEGMWLYASAPVGSPIAPIALASTHAIFVAGGRSVLMGSHDGVIRSLPLDPAEIEGELNQIAVRSREAADSAA